MTMKLLVILVSTLVLVSSMELRRQVAQGKRKVVIPQTIINVLPAVRYLLLQKNRQRAAEEGLLPNSYSLYQDRQGSLNGKSHEEIARDHHLTPLTEPLVFVNGKSMHNHEGLSSLYEQAIQQQLAAPAPDTAPPVDASYQYEQAIQQQQVLPPAPDSSEPPVEASYPLDSGSLEYLNVSPPSSDFTYAPAPAPGSKQNYEVDMFPTTQLYDYNFGSIYVSPPSKDIAYPRPPGSRHISNTADNLQTIDNHLKSGEIRRKAPAPPPLVFPTSPILYPRNPAAFTMAHFFPNAPDIKIESDKPINQRKHVQNSAPKEGKGKGEAKKPLAEELTTAPTTASTTSTTTTTTPTTTTTTTTTTPTTSTSSTTTTPTTTSTTTTTTTEPTTTSTTTQKPTPQKPTTKDMMKVIFEDPNEPEFSGDIIPVAPIKVSDLKMDKQEFAQHITGEPEEEEEYTTASEPTTNETTATAAVDDLPSTTTIIPAPIEKEDTYDEPTYQIPEEPQTEYISEDPISEDEQTGEIPAYNGEESTPDIIQEPEYQLPEDNLSTEEAEAAPEATPLDEGNEYEPILVDIQPNEEQIEPVIVEPQEVLIDEIVLTPDQSQDAQQPEISVALSARIEDNKQEQPAEQEIETLNAIDSEPTTNQQPNVPGEPSSGPLWPVASGGDTFLWPPQVSVNDPEPTGQQVTVTDASGETESITLDQTTTLIQKVDEIKKKFVHSQPPLSEDFNMPEIYNQNIYCCLWASRGYCTTHESWMLKNCYLSCGSQGCRDNGRACQGFETCAIGEWPIRVRKCQCENDRIGRKCGIGHSYDGLSGNRCYY